MHTNADIQTVVIGGTGKTGRRVVERLNALDVPTRIGSRAGDPPFDWEDPSTWAEAIGDAGAAYVTYYPDLAVPGAPDLVRSLAELAVERGVRRIVLLSGRGEEGAMLGEEAVKQAGAEWTILRASWFNQNFSENYLLEPVLAGEVALPAGSTKEPFVDADDIADVAVAALTQEGHVGETYELTGPRLLGFGEAVAEIAAATGREIRYVPVSADDYAAALADHGVPADVTALLRYLFTEVLDGRNAHLDTGVQRALGREPRDFRDYARSAAASGIWSSHQAVSAP